MRHLLRGWAARRPGRLEALRFVLVGGLNTLLSLVVYQLALFWIGEKAAWTLAWGSGILFVSVAYPKLVFTRGRLTWRRCATNGVYYALSYGISLSLLAGMVSLGLHPRGAALVVASLMVPVNFLCSRCIFTVGTA